jgi:lipopolysaccharide transport system ATP-binding protein
MGVEDFMNAIEIHNLGKSYQIAHGKQKHETLISATLDTLKGPLRRLNGLLKGNMAAASNLDRSFWALRHINLDVKDGEILGIIGDNGAGKSTLLKILSRITVPTEGYARINGRVGSLLEVGTGFNPELTGRENIYLNGSILGMSKAEIDAKFSQILNFAEIMDFIDTPTKHYSSGMTVRLAFSIAVHLDPEILLIDEVLGVGDYAFQKKSLERIKEITRQGRTVLFVSHQLDMVREICERVVLLRSGQIEMVGQAEEVIQFYVKRFGESVQRQSSFSCPIEPHRPFQLLAGQVLNDRGEQSRIFDVFDPIFFEFDYELRKPVEGLTINFMLKRAGEPLLLSFDTDKYPDRLSPRAPGTYRTRVQLPNPLLKSGSYLLDVKIGYIGGRGKDLHEVDNVLYFEVDFVSTQSTMLSYAAEKLGRFALELDWIQETFNETL